MLKDMKRLLGEEAAVLSRYLYMTVSYALLSGLTIITLVPALGRLLAGDAQSAMLWFAVLLAGVLVCWVLRRQVEQAGIAVGVAVLRGGRQCIGDHVATLPLGWFDATNKAQLGHVISQGMMTVAQLPAHVFTPLISSLLTPLVIVGALFVVQWQLGLIALLALPFLAGILGFTSGLGASVDAAFQRDFAATSQRVVEFAQSQSVLRAFNGEGGGTRLLEEAIEQQRQSAARLIFRSSLSAVLNAWAVQMIFSVLLLVAGLLLAEQINAHVEASSMIVMVVALLLIGRYIDSLLEVASYGEILRSAKGQLAAAMEILAAQALPETGQPQTPADSSIELRHVSFAYAPGQDAVLNEINLRVAPGSMVALIGASGSGKTTLVRLIARFFDVSQGSLLVGGVDVRHMGSEQLAGQISQIFQDSHLFQGTIADNIRIGRTNASDDDILQAARQAGVTSILARMPDGINTQVGEGGARLSGGERQRIAVARALLKDAPILLVDEATAALDTENQAVIAETLARMRGRRTLVVIAHQLSTVALADHIVVLENGCIVEQGAPDTLRTAGGRYALFLHQRQMAKGRHIAVGDEQELA